MKEEDKGMPRSNPLKILGHADRMDSVLMRFLRSRTQSMIQHRTNDNVGGFSSCQSPSPAAETLKTEPTSSVNMKAERLEVLLRFSNSTTKTIIQQSAYDGVGGYSSTESPVSPAETLKTKPKPSVKMEENALAIDDITVDELLTPDSLDFDGSSELERQKRFMEEENKGLSRSNTPKILRLAQRMDSVLMRCLLSRTKPMTQHSTTDDLGGSVSGESPLSPAETLETEPTPWVNMKEVDGITVKSLLDMEQMTSDDSDFYGISELELQPCRDFLWTGRCLMGTMCPFSHQPQPPLLPPQREPPPPPPPPAEVVTPVLPPPPPPLQPVPMHPGAASSSTLASAPTKSNDGSFTTTTTTTDSDAIKADSAPTGDVGTGSISTRSAAPLSQRPPPPAQTPKSSREAAVAGGSGTASTSTSNSTLVSATAATNNEGGSSTTNTTADWSPMDDGIDATLPGSSSGNPPSREDLNDYIYRFLYDTTKPRSCRRLPVFQEICPDTDTDAKNHD